MIRNIKCSMITDGLVIKNLRRNQTHKFTIGSVKVFIFGHTPNLVNMTGLKCFEDVETTREMIEFGYDVKCTDIRVDNIFISHKDRRNLDMSKVYDYARLMYFTLYLVDYNIELFPGMFFKPKCQGWPTILLFRTGSFQIMGGKDLHSILEAKTLVQNIVSMFVK